jgi:hypothetical protein
VVRIGICGKHNSGKNTAAEELIGDIDYLKMPGFSSQVVAFADPIKEIAELMFPWADKDGWYGASHLREQVIPNTNGITYRQVLVDVGTLARSYDPDHWVKVFDARHHDSPRDTLVACDVRFRNEFDYLRKEGFFLIKLIRNTTSTSSSPTETAQDEIQLHEFDAVIENNGTLVDLRNKLRDIKPQIIAKCHQNTPIPASTYDGQTDHRSISEGWKRTLLSLSSWFRR